MCGRGAGRPELCPCHHPLALGSRTAVKLLVAEDLWQSPEAVTPHVHLLPSTRLSSENAASTAPALPGSPFCVIPEGSGLITHLGVWHRAEWELCRAGEDLCSGEESTFGVGPAPAPCAAGAVGHFQLVKLGMLPKTVLHWVGMGKEDQGVQGGRGKRWLHSVLRTSALREAETENPFFLSA